MSERASLQSLSNELIRQILDQIEPDPERTVPIDDRRFISVESFDLTPQPDASKDIGCFRLTCKRFADLGAPLLFTLVQIRFSRHGLKRLAQFAGWVHLTGHVKKFSYLMPYFYPNGEDLRTAVPTNGGVGPDMGFLHQKAAEQHEIIASGYDLEILKRAFRNFQSLQFVKLLPVAEENDRRFREYVQVHGSLRDFVNLYWTPAITHGSRTIGDALLTADIPSSWSRLYLPVESVESVGFLACPRPPSVAILAARLTCLTLAFDEGHDVEENITELSELFKIVFTSAKNMQAVHIGFPRNRPVNLPLEAVFHDVVWDKLIAFGVAGWDLTAEEIISLVLRHKHKLRGLRLRDVHLKEGMWKDVLSTLRFSMPRLKWVSLRRIGYVPGPDEMEDVGAEVPDDQPWANSDSDSEDDDEFIVPGPNETHQVQNGSGHQTMPSEGSGGNAPQAADENFDSDSSGDEHESENHATEFPDLESPTIAPTTAFHGSVGTSFDSLPDELLDDGTPVSNAKRKIWERWVISHQDPLG